jgi:hypothetical protein
MSVGVLCGEDEGSEQHWATEYRGELGLEGWG